MPGNILPVWDEITADVVGLLCATGRYDVGLAARFLGVDLHGYTGGRLAVYLNEQQVKRIDEVAAEVFGACDHIGQMCGADEAANPFGFLLGLKQSPLVSY